MFTRPGLIFLFLIGCLVLAILLIARLIMLLRSRTLAATCPDCKTRLRLYRGTPNQRLLGFFMGLSAHQLSCPVCGASKLVFMRG